MQGVPVEPKPKPKPTPTPTRDSGANATPNQSGGAPVQGGSKDTKRQGTTRADGKHLDAQVPPEQRQQQYEEQKRLQQEVAAAAAAPEAPKDRTDTRKREPNAKVNDTAQANRANAISIQEQYWNSHDTYVDADGTVYAASFNSGTGKLELERHDVIDTPQPASATTEQPASLNVTRTQSIDLDGSRVRTHSAQGKLSNGTDTSTIEEDVDAQGAVRQTRTAHTRNTRAGNVATNVHETATYDANGVETHGESTTTVNDGDTKRTTVERNTDEFANGNLVSRHGTVDVTGPGEEPGSTIEAHSVTDSKFNERGEPTWVHSTGDTTINGLTEGKSDDEPDVDWSQNEKTDTLIDGHGASIVDASGNLVVTPIGTLDRTQTSRVVDAGQDNDTDLVTVTTAHAKTDANGELVFDSKSRTKETSEGKDGDTGRTWDSPIDPKTGQLIESPPANWKPPTGTDADRTEAWQQQNVNNFDERSGWRKFKDGATKYAGIGAAVLGTALLFTGVGTAAGAALLVGSAALGTFALGSTVADYATGRNHVTGLDVGLAAAMVIPGVGAGASRLGARAVGAAAKLGEGTSTARALTTVGRGFDAAGKAMTAGYAGYETYRVGDTALSGESVGTMDVLNLLAAYGGTKHAFGSPRTTAPSTRRPLVEMSTRTDDIVVTHLDVPGTNTVRGGGNVDPIARSLVGGEHGPGIGEIGGTRGVSIEQLLVSGTPHTHLVGSNGKVTLPTKGTPGNTVYTTDAPNSIRGYAHIGEDGVTTMMVRQNLNDGSWSAMTPTDGTWNPNTVHTRAATAEEIPTPLGDDHVRALVDGRSTAIRTEAGTVDPDLSIAQLTHITRRHTQGFRDFVKHVGVPDDGVMVVPDRVTGTTKIERINNGRDSYFSPDIDGPQIRDLVRTTLADGSWMRAEGGAYDVVLDTGRTIGVGRSGTPTNLMKVTVVDGQVKSGFPVDAGTFREGLHRDLGSFRPRELGHATTTAADAPPLEPPLPRDQEIIGGLRPREDALASHSSVLTGSIRTGDGLSWNVTGSDGAGGVQLSRPALRRRSNVEMIIEQNAQLVARLGGADAVRANPSLLDGRPLTIRRSSGEIQPGWRTNGEVRNGSIELALDEYRSMDVGEVLVRRQQADPTFDGRSALRSILASDPSSLSGRPLRLRRSDTSIAKGNAAHTIDDGWYIRPQATSRGTNRAPLFTLEKQYRFEQLSPRFQAQLASEGRGPGSFATVKRRGITLDELLDFNRARLEGDHGQLPDIQVRIGSSTGPKLGTNRDLVNHPAAADADQAVVHTRAALDYLYSRFNYRPSGGDMTLVIDAASTPNNASMQSRGNILSIGKHTGTTASFDPSVLMHELGHKVIDDFTSGDYGRTQAGAIHEGVADVFSTAWTHDPMLGRIFGEPGQAIRDVRTGKELIVTHDQWLAAERANRSAVDAAERGVEAHAGSGVVSGVASRIADTLGWDQTGDLFFNALNTGALRRQMNFEAFGDALRIAAARQHGITSDQYRSVVRSLDTAGIRPTLEPGASVSRITSRSTVEHGYRVIGVDPDGTVRVQDRNGTIIRQSPSQLLASGGRSVPVDVNGQAIAAPPRANGATLAGPDERMALPQDITTPGAPSRVMHLGGRNSMDLISGAVRGASDVRAQVFALRGPVAEAMHEASNRSGRVDLVGDPELIASNGYGAATNGMNIRPYTSEAFQARALKQLRGKLAGNAQAIRSIADQPERVLELLRINPKNRTAAHRQALEDLGIPGEQRMRRLKNHAKALVIDRTRAFISTAAFMDGSNWRQELTFEFNDPKAVGALDRWMQASDPKAMKAAARDMADHEIFVNDPAAGKNQFGLTDRIVGMINDVQSGETIRVATKAYTDKGRANRVSEAIDSAVARGAVLELVDPAVARALSLHANAVITPRGAYAGTAHLTKGALEGAGSGRQSREIGVVTSDATTIDGLNGWMDAIVARGPDEVTRQTTFRDQLTVARNRAKAAGQNAVVARIEGRLKALRRLPLREMDALAVARKDAAFIVTAIQDPRVVAALNLDERGLQALRTHATRMTTNDVNAFMNSSWLRSNASRIDAILNADAGVQFGAHSAAAS